MCSLNMVIFTRTPYNLANDTNHQREFLSSQRHHGIKEQPEKTSGIRQRQPESQWSVPCDVGWRSCYCACSYNSTPQASWCGNTVDYRRLARCQAEPVNCHRCNTLCWGVDSTCWHQIRLRDQRLQEASWNNFRVWENYILPLPNIRWCDLCLKWVKSLTLVLHKSCRFKLLLLEK